MIETRVQTDIATRMEDYVSRVERCETQQDVIGLLPEARELYFAYTPHESVPEVHKPAGTIKSGINPLYFNFVDVDIRLKLRDIEEGMTYPWDAPLSRPKYVWSTFTSSTLGGRGIRDIQDIMECEEADAMRVQTELLLSYAEMFSLVYYLSREDRSDRETHERRNLRDTKDSDYRLMLANVSPGYRLDQEIRQWFIYHVGDGHERVHYVQHDDGITSRIGLTGGESQVYNTIKSCPAGSKHITYFFNHLAHLTLTYAPLITVADRIAEQLSENAPVNE